MGVNPRVWLCAWAVLLVGCAGLRQVHDTDAVTSGAPLLRLHPASLGTSLALQQQLFVEALGHTHQVDVLLEADHEALNLALLSLGQTVARLHWDGQRLTQQRSPWLPDTVRGERILSDLQLVLWPADAVRAALPADWTLEASAAHRVLRQAGDAVISVSLPSDRRAELVHHREGYRLRIESRPLGAPHGGQP